MYSTAEVWGIALLAIAVGAAIGYLLQRQLHAAPRRNREVEQQLHALQDQHKNYRYDVNAHFNRTAELLGQLAESYREVHNHLARGAGCLSTQSLPSSNIWCPLGNLFAGIPFASL